jgi:hypothetical protein
MATDPSPTTDKNLRWFRPTPAQLLIVLLVVEGSLLLSKPWFPKGWAVLIAIASVGVTMVLMLIWWLIALLFHWQFQFSLRSLLVATVAVAIPFSWLAVEMKRAREQREAVEGIRKLGGTIYYHYQASFLPDANDESNDVSGPLSNDVSATFIIEQADPPGPEWLRGAFGIDYVAEVVYVKVRLLTDDEMQYLQALPQIHSLVLNDSNVTDAGLHHLVGLTQLHELELRNTKITDDGIRYLQNAFPNLGVGYP